MQVVIKIHIHRADTWEILERIQKKLLELSVLVIFLQVPPKYGEYSRPNFHFVHEELHKCLVTTFEQVDADSHTLLHLRMIIWVDKIQNVGEDAGFVVVSKVKFQVRQLLRDIILLILDLCNILEDWKCVVIDLVRSLCHHLICVSLLDGPFYQIFMNSQELVVYLREKISWRNFFDLGSIFKINGQVFEENA